MHVAPWWDPEELLFGALAALRDIRSPLSLAYNENNEKAALSSSWLGLCGSSLVGHQMSPATFSSMALGQSQPAAQCGDQDDDQNDHADQDHDFLLQENRKGATGVNWPPQ